MTLEKRLQKLERKHGFESEQQRQGAYEIGRRMGLENPEEHIHCEDDLIELLRQAYRNRDGTDSV